MLNHTTSDKKLGEGLGTRLCMTCVLILTASTETDSDAFVVLYRYSRVTCSTNVFIKSRLPY